MNPSNQAPSMQPAAGKPSLSSMATRRGQVDRQPGAHRLSAAQPGGRSLDSNKIEAAYVGYHKTFHDRLTTASGIHRRFATVVETQEMVDRQIWLTANPLMRQWLGDKVLNKYRAESHPIVTTPQEVSVEVPKRDIQNDRLGLYKPRIARLADSYEAALDTLAIGLVVAGIQGVALGMTYDGQNLIDTDHTALSVGGTSQSNKVTGALSTSTFALARRRFLEIVDQNGQPVNQAGRRKTLFVGPANEDVALNILAAQQLANGASNIYRDSVDLVVTEHLAARTILINGVSVTLTGLEWFMTVEDSSAILIHVRQPPEFLSVEDGAFVFMHGICLYGIEAEFGGAYGLWQEIVGGSGA